MTKNKWSLLIIIGFALGSLQIGIMYDCSVQGGEISFLSCVEIINELEYIQNKNTLSIQSDNSIILIEVEIVDKFEEQVKGLMFRENLDWNSGMLFVYENEKTRSFWMKNTLIPLDMLFINKDFRIIDIKENVQPCKTESCPSYPSKFPAKYVLEVNAGFTMMNDIKIGDSIIWNPKK